MLALRIALTTIAVMLVGGCDETATSHYSTRADAESQALFGRGWLPDIIPASSRDITTNNDLDLNLSEGEFSFDPVQSSAFVGQLLKMEQSEVSGSDAEGLVDRGYWPYHYSDEGSTWVFLVNSSTGHCEYHMGLTRTTNSEQDGDEQAAAALKSKL